jgi:branched-chain amino acid transport system ATP-binding protein
MATSDEPQPPAAFHAAATEGSGVEIEDPIVRISNVVAGYIPGVNILNGVDMSVADGELVGIIGPNGAGKSTVLKALFGLVKVGSGTVELRGEDITGKKAHRLVEMGLAYVPQNNNVFPRLTVEENLEMGAFTQP